MYFHCKPKPCKAYRDLPCNDPVTITGIGGNPSNPVVNKCYLTIGGNPSNHVIKKVLMKIKTKKNHYRVDTCSVNRDFPVLVTTFLCFNYRVFPA
jgi:hypothetical protein